MDRYDAEVQPNVTQWLELSEQRRISLVEKHHRGSRLKAPQLRAHVAIHVIVENQLAEGLESVVRAVGRLRSEGLSRHDAIHAIGSVIAENIYDLVTGKIAEEEAQVICDAGVERLNAKSWHDG